MRNLLLAISIAAVALLSFAVRPAFVAEQTAGRLALNDTNSRLPEANTPLKALRPKNSIRVARGAECPRGSGKYCSDTTPYCCPGVSVAPYCATNVNGCTK
jgi:hypothetical protein